MSKCGYDNRDAVARCKKCGINICIPCSRTFNNTILCKACTVEMYMRHCSLVRLDSDSDEQGRK